MDDGHFRNNNQLSRYNEIKSDVLECCKKNGYKERTIAFVPICAYFGNISFFFFKF